MLHRTYATFYIYRLPHLDPSTLKYNLFTGLEKPTSDPSITTLTAENKVSPILNISVEYNTSATHGILH